MVRGATHIRKPGNLYSLLSVLKNTFSSAMEHVRYVSHIFVIPMSLCQYSLAACFGI